MAHAGVIIDVVSMRPLLIAMPVAAVIWSTSTDAQMFFSDVVAIELRQEKVSAGFARHPQMELTPLGLETRQPWTENAIREFWFHTPPLPTGPSWRPPTSVGVELTLNDLYVVEKTFRVSIRTFGRYSADRVHWSSWFPIAATPPTASTVRTFEGRLELPRFAQARYQELMQAWWKTNPAWGSDEHEFFLWLAATHRDYLEAEIPVMGYVQFLVEGTAGGFRVGGLTIRLNAGMSGVSAIPRGPRRPGADEKWFFDLARTGA